MTRSRIEELFQRVSDNTIIKSIRQGLLLIMPLIMVGSFVLMLLNLPIEAINNLLDNLLGDHWRTVGLLIHKGTFRIMSVSTLFAVSYALAMEKRSGYADYINPMAVMLTAFSCYIAFDPVTESVLDENATGPTGMFGSIVIAIVATYLFLLYHRLLPRKDQLFAYDSDAILVSSLHNMLPSFFTVATFAFARLISNMLDIRGMIDQISQNFTAAFLESGGSILTTILYNLSTHVMWFFGIHGTNVMENVSQELFVTASEANIAQAAAGGIPAQVLTKEFFDIFVYMGGAGCTIGLILALIIGGKRNNAGGLARYSVFPGLFNINEAIVYGLPIIFNPYYLVPFLLTPQLLSITSYLAFSTGLVPLTTARVVWTTPLLISGYVSTGSVRGILLQLFNLGLATVVYLPFVRLYDRQLAEKNKGIYQTLLDAYRENHPECPGMLQRGDAVGLVARSLAKEIEEALHREEGALRLEYQPKSLENGRVYGAEALLRWEHPVYGPVSPLVVLGLSEEAGLTNELGNWVLAHAFAEQRRWMDQGLELTLSVNLSPSQVKGDADLVDRLKELIERYGLDPATMELELTEHAALDQGRDTRRKLGQLREMGIHIAIDDFGMGSSSLRYLRDYYANVVKIDMSLVRSIDSDKKSQEIVRTTLSLCQQLDVGVVAEGVETRKQLDILLELGCGHFQGWLFSKSLQPDEFLSYVLRKGTALPLRTVSIEQPVCMKESPALAD